MKRIIVLSIFSATVISLTAQITINRNDLIKSGQVVIQATDTTGYAVQTGGANKTWNFSTLKTHSLDTQKFNPPQWYLGNTYFPNANLAISGSSNDSSFTYIKLNNTELSVEGSYDLVGDTFNVNRFNRTIITFPSTYNTTFTQNSITPFQIIPLGVDLDSSGPLPFIDSLKISGDSRVSSNIEGWGTVITPLGSFSALLQNTRSINMIKLDMLTGGVWINVPASVAAALGFGTFKADTGYDHQFWTNDASVGYPIVSYSYSQGEDSTSSTNWLKTKPQTTNVADNFINSSVSFYPNPCHNAINVSISASINANLYIYDLNGKLVKNILVENGSTVDISIFNNGVYTLKFKDVSNDSMLLVQKMIKF